MKNRIHILVATATYLALTGLELQGMDRSNHLKNLEIAALKAGKKSLVEEIRICNGLNIGLGVAGFAGGISSGLGLFFKDKVLEVTGIVASTVASALFITTNCMQCCQNPREKDEDEGYGDL